MCKGCLTQGLGFAEHHPETMSSAGSQGLEAIPLTH